MRHLKVFGIAYLTNGVLISLFLLLFGDGDFGITTYYSIVVLQWIFFPLWYAVLTNYLITKIDFGRKIKRIVTLRIVCLTALLLLTESSISMFRTVALDHLTWDNFQEHFFNVWGHFVPTTILTGIMLPLIDYYQTAKTPHNTVHKSWRGSV